MRGCGKAVLATRMAEDDAPYASLVTVALDHDGSPILLLSTLADHTRNVGSDARAALLFDGTEGFPNPQEGPRLTVMGRMERSGDDRLRRRFLARHPGAALYAGFADFAIWRLAPERAHLVGGFARAVWIPGGPTLDAAVAGRMAEAEEDIVGRANRDAGRLDLIAARALGRRERGWLMTGIDADGLDLRCGPAYARVDFERPVGDGQEAIQAIADLAAGTGEQSDNRV